MVLKYIAWPEYPLPQISPIPGFYSYNINIDGSMIFFFNINLQFLQYIFFIDTGNRYIYTKIKNLSVESHNIKCILIQNLKITNGNVNTKSFLIHNLNYIT